MLSRIVPLFAATLIATGCATSDTTETTSIPAPEGALTSNQLVSLMSGATLSGNSTQTEGATFSQSYNDIPARKIKGKASGTWNPPEGAQSVYAVSWRLKGDQWCEKWDGGGACWHVVPLSGSDYQFYEDGAPINQTWKIDSPNPGPLRLTPEEIKIALTNNQINAGTWQYKGAGGNESGTFTTHACTDGTRFASVDDKPFNKGTWSFQGDKMCATDKGKKRCFGVWQLADGSFNTYRKTEGGVVTSTSSVQGASDKCSV